MRTGACPTVTSAPAPEECGAQSPALRRRAAGRPAPGTGLVQSQRRSPTPVRQPVERKWRRGRGLRARSPREPRTGEKRLEVIWGPARACVGSGTGLVSGRGGAGSARAASVSVRTVVRKKDGRLLRESRLFPRVGSLPTSASDVYLTPYLPCLLPLLSAQIA